MSTYSPAQFTDPVLEGQLYSGSYNTDSLSKSFAAKVGTVIALASAPSFAVVDASYSDRWVNWDVSTEMSLLTKDIDRLDQKSSEAVNELDKHRIVERELIHEISILKDNWDDCGALSVSEQCIQNSLNVIDSFGPSVQSADIYPNPHGTISFDWDVGQNYLSIEIGDQGYSFFWESGDNVEMDSGLLQQNPPVSLLFALQKIF